MKNEMKIVDWNLLRETYIKGGISLRALAKEGGVSFHTLAKRCKKEGWATTKETLPDLVRRHAEEAAAQSGENLGISVASLEAKTLSISGQLLTRVSEEIARPDLRAENLRTLAATFTDAVKMGRLTHRLDSDTRSAVPAVSITIIDAVNAAFLQQE